MITEQSLQARQESGWIAECLLDALERRDPAGLGWVRQRVAELARAGSGADAHTSEIVELLGALAGGVGGARDSPCGAHRDLLRHLVRTAAAAKTPG